MRFRRIDLRIILLLILGQFLVHTDVLARSYDSTLLRKEFVTIDSLLREKQFDDAIDRLMRAEGICLEAGDIARLDLHYIYSRLGFLYTQFHDYEKALTFRNKVIELAEKLYSQNHWKYAWALHRAAYVFYMTGDYASSLDYYQQAQSILDQYPPPEEQKKAENMYYLGNSYWGLGMHYDALLVFLKLYPVFQSCYADNKKRMGDLLNNIGTMYWELGYEDSALVYYQKGMEVDLAGDPQYKKASWIPSADDSEEIKNSQALKYYFAELNERQNIHGAKHWLTAGCYNFIGRTFERMDSPEKALRHYQMAIVSFTAGFEDSSILANPRVLGKISSEHYLMDALSRKARLLFDLYVQNQDDAYLHSAYEAIQLAGELIDRLRSTGYLAKGTRQFWSSEALPLYELALNILETLYLKEGKARYVEEAFEISEKGKSFLLLQSLRTNSGLAFAGIPDSVLAKERLLKQKIGDYDRYLNLDEGYCAKDQQNKFKLLQNAAFELRREYEGFILELEKKYPSYYNLKYNTSTVGTQHLQDQFLQTHSRTAIIEYFLGEESCYRFVLSPEGLHFHRLGSSRDIVPYIDTLRTAIGSLEFLQTAPSQSYQLYTRSAHQLYQILLSDVAELLADSIDRYIIVPDGRLGYLPFDLLLQEKADQEKRDYSSLAYLIEDYTISYTASATVLLEANADRRFEHDYLGYAPKFDQQSPSFAALNNREQLEPLRFNAMEIQQAAKLFNGKALIGTHATESNLKAGVHQAGILHLATHAIVNDTNPDFSSLYLPELSESQQDGQLFTYELYNLHLQTQLVVLSACNTGFGQWQRGEGIISLARGFRYAGCPSIVMSMWQVDDQSTASIVTDFLGSLKSGLSKDSALRTAKLSWLDQADPLFAHPYFWAGLSLSGDRNPLQITTGGELDWKWLLALFVLVSLGLVFAKRFR